MRTSPIWTATYETLGHRCWSETWGQPDGPEIPADTALALAKKFLAEHTKPTPEVPELCKISYLFPYEHKRVGFAAISGEVYYHERT